MIYHKKRICIHHMHFVGVNSWQYRGFGHVAQTPNLLCWLLAVVIATYSHHLG